MKLTTTCLAAILSITATTQAQLIIGDDYNVTPNGTGFALGSGVNSGINPPDTRLTGAAADDLRYLNIGNRGAGLYSITDNRFQVNGGAAFGAATLSANGTSAFDFSSVLGSAAATPSNPVIYEIAIGMANNYGGATPRFSFGIGTVEPLDGVGQAGLWDFGIQLHRNVSGGTAYGVSERIQMASGGLEANLNNVIATTADGTYGTEVNFLIRITDAGAESDSYNSRVQVSMDGGAFFYDTDDHAGLPSGFRFDGLGRYLTWDMAGNGSNGGEIKYDNFSITVVPEPSTFALAGLGGLALVYLRRQHRK